MYNITIFRFKNLDNQLKHFDFFKQELEFYGLNSEGIKLFNFLSSTVFKLRFIKQEPPSRDLAI